MQLPGFSIRSEPSPVIDPVSGITVLLDLQNKIAGPDGMQSTAGDIVGITGLRIVYLQHTFHLIRIIKDILQADFSCTAIQSRHDFSSGFSGNNIPHFRFWLRSVSDFAAGLFIRMNLQAQSFSGINNFDQQRETDKIFSGSAQQIPPVMLN